MQPHCLIPEVRPVICLKSERYLLLELGPDFFLSSFLYSMHIYREPIIVRNCFPCWGYSGEQMKFFPHGVYIPEQETGSKQRAR